MKSAVHVAVNAHLSSSKMATGQATELFFAAIHGRTHDVTALIADGFDVNETTMVNGNRKTPLYVACHRGHTEIATKRACKAHWAERARGNIV